MKIKWERFIHPMGTFYSHFILYLCGVNDMGYDIVFSDKRRRFRCMAAPESVEFANVHTGELIDGLRLTGVDREIDSQRFVKLYDYSFLMRLGKSGIGVLCYVMSRLGYGSSFRFDYDECRRYCAYESRRSVTVGLNELLRYDVLRKKSGHEFYINPNLLYRGDRRKYKV